MSNSAKYWDNNVSIKTKKAVQEALGVELIRQTELDEKLAVVGRDERKAEAKESVPSAVSIERQGSLPTR